MNIDRAKRIVENDILMCCSMLAEACFQNGIWNYEDIETHEYYEYHGSEYSRDYLEDIYNIMSDDDSTEEIELIELENALENPMYHEIYEYWFITKWLYGKLQENNYPCMKTPQGNYVMCRCTTGQATYMDSIIQTIAEG